METLVKRIQNGEDNLILELWERVRRFVFRQAVSFYRCVPSPRCELDDLMQSGFIGVLVAVHRFEDNRGARFKTFLSHYLRSSFQSAAGLRNRADAMQHAFRSLDEQLRDEDDLTLLGDTIEDMQAAQAFNDCERRIYNEQLHEALDRILQQLDSDEADTIRRLYYDGLSAKEIGTEHEVKATAARALRKCRTPAMTKELYQFLEDATPSKIGGLRPTEKAVLMREDLARTGFREKLL